MACVGLLYIGQAPRPDYVEFFRAALPPGTEVLEAGALDDLDLEGIRGLPRTQDEPILIMQTRDRVTVTAPEREVQARMHEKVDYLEQRGAEIILVVCTGDFSALRSRRLLLKPSEILLHSVLGVASGYPIGVMTPLPEQVPQTKAKWKAAGMDPAIEAASPFGDGGELEEAARRLLETDPALIVLDCMGYDQTSKERVRRATGKPVVAARTIVRHVAAELLR